RRLFLFQGLLFSRFLLGKAFFFREFFFASLLLGGFFLRRYFFLPRFVLTGLLFAGLLLSQTALFLAARALPFLLCFLALALFNGNVRFRRFGLGQRWRRRWRRLRNGFRRRGWRWCGFRLGAYLCGRGQGRR